MRRAVARGRMFPQSYSTDRRYGRLSLKAIGLFPLMWSNADDQGRLCGDPEEIKYAVCPNIEHITKQDIPGLLKELQNNNLILCYDTPKSPALQLLDWWDANQKMQWAWPSELPPPKDWQDHLRYKKDAKTVMTQSWPISGESDSGVVKSIYLILDEAASAIKIGISDSPDRRLSQLQATNPHPLKLLKVIENSTLSEEQALHQRFAKSAINAEWFEYSEEIQAFVSGEDSGETQEATVENLVGEIRSELLGKENREELGEEIRVELMSLPDFKSYLVEHEMVREALANLGAKKGCLPKQEVTTALGRVDLCWEGTGGEFMAAFEIDAYSPKKKSLAKLKALACPYSFVILRSNPEPFQWEQDIALIGLGRVRGKKSKSRQGPLPSPEIKTINKTINITINKRGRGNSPEDSGERSGEKPSSPSLTGLPLFQSLKDTFPQAFGRNPNSRETAQLRDLGKEISAAGGAMAEQVHDAFKEACGQNKLSVSYVRAILLDWLGVERNRSP